MFFALGKAFEDLKDYDRSFDNYQKGNNLLKKLINFEIENEKKDFENIKKIFSNNYKNITLNNSRKIIFIVGMPRSGTSLVEQILSSHNNVYGGGELVFLKKILNDKIFSTLESKDILPKMNESFFQELANEYLEKISQIDNSDKTFTDKAPLNFRYIGFIKKMFPNSKIINCNRNSLDICWSNYKNFFGESLPFTNSMKDLANYFKLYKNLINFWDNKFPKDIYQMNYELLVNDSLNEVKKMLSFCELNWDPNCMKHEKNKKQLKQLVHLKPENQ